MAYSVIFDQFQHPNQAYWKVYLEFVRERVRVEVFANKKFGNPEYPFQLLRDNRHGKGYIRKVLGKKPSLNVPKSGVVHFINSQLFPHYKYWFEAGSKLIFSFRGYDVLVRPKFDPDWKKDLQEIFKVGHLFHFVSHHILEEGIKLGAPKDRSMVIERSVPNWVQSDSINEHQSDQTVMLSVGRLTWEKGLDQVFWAVRKCVDEGYDVIWNHIGDGPEKGKMAFLEERFGLKGRVYFLGSKDSKGVKENMAKTDLFLHPSLSDAFPNAALEAAASGLTVLGCKNTGLSELLSEQNDQILVEYGDQESFYRNLVTLISDNELTKRIGRSNQENVLGKYSKKQEERKWENFISTAIG